MSEKDAFDVAARNTFLENVTLKEQLTGKDAQIETLKKALQKATDSIEAQERARMIPTILASTKLTKAEVEAMDTASLMNLLDSFRVLKQPVAGVKPGTDEAERNRLTVGSLFKFGPKGGS